jgi:DNA (cytosine-5)-methyltransferase 1
MKVLDLFSGIGGFSLGLERAGFETVGFCEIDPFCRAVLAKHWPHIPCHDDIRSFDATEFVRRSGDISVVCGGPPCQPSSLAGKRLGAKDERWLWGEFVRIVRAVRPAWIVAENPPSFLTVGDESERVFRDLEDEGYAIRSFVFEANDLGSPHHRARVWIVANTASLGCGSGTERRFDSGVAREPEQAFSRDTADASGMCGVAVQREQSHGVVPSNWRISWPEYLETIRGMDDGVSGRVDGLRSLGNAVVPQCVELIGRAILAADSTVDISPKRGDTFRNP